MSNIVMANAYGIYLIDNYFVEYREIELITCKGDHISKTLTLHDYKRRPEVSCNCKFNYKGDSRH